MGYCESIYKYLVVSSNDELPRYFIAIVRVVHELFVYLQASLQVALRGSTAIIWISSDSLLLNVSPYIEWSLEST